MRSRFWVLKIENLTKYNSLEHKNGICNIKIVSINIKILYIVLWNKLQWIFRKNGIYILLNIKIKLFFKWYFELSLEWMLHCIKILKFFIPALTFNFNFSTFNCSFTAPAPPLHPPPLPPLPIVFIFMVPHNNHYNNHFNFSFLIYLHLGAQILRISLFKIHFPILNW